MKREAGRGEKRKMEMEWKWVGWRSITLMDSLKIWVVLIELSESRTCAVLLDIVVRAAKHRDH